MADGERSHSDKAEGMKRSGRRQEQVWQRLGSSERWRRLVRCLEGDQSSNNIVGVGGERAGRRQLHRRFGTIATVGGEEELAGGRCNRGDRWRGAAVTLAITRSAARAGEDAATEEAAAGVGGKATSSRSVSLVQDRAPPPSSSSTNRAVACLVSAVNLASKIGPTALLLRPTLCRTAAIGAPHLSA
ncbi:hypothetical protein BHE74_00039910 [Ensete ventricosum]|nr:hypothetical protein BHE74_00039910 [Ensete ventricosum]